MMSCEGSKSHLGEADLYSNCSRADGASCVLKKVTPWNREGEHYSKADDTSWRAVGYSRADRYIPVCFLY